MHNCVQPSVFPNIPLNLAAMIAHVHFRAVNRNIVEANFPLAGPFADVADMLTVSQEDLGGQYMTTFEIEAAIDRDGYRPATLAEQIAYAKAKWNGRDRVAALGSSWVHPDGDCSVACLYEGIVGRGLSLECGSPGYRWNADWSFLVVRK